MKQYAETAVEEIRQKVGGKKTFWRYRAGVDSSVAAALLSKAVGSQLTCIFVDHGLMRKNEGDEVENAFKDKEITFVRVNAEQRFLDRLCRRLQNRKASGKSSEKNLSACLRKKQKNRRCGFSGTGNHLSRRDRIRGRGCRGHQKSS